MVCIKKNSQTADEIAAKIVLGYLSEKSLVKTCKCFLNEYSFTDGVESMQNKDEMSETLQLPSLEDILEDYFSISEDDGLKSDALYRLWKNLDVIVNQLRGITLGKNKNSTFIKSKRNFGKTYQKIHTLKRKDRNETGILNDKSEINKPLNNDSNISKAMLYINNANKNDDTCSVSNDKIEVSEIGKSQREQTRFNSFPTSTISVSKNNDVESLFSYSHFTSIHTNVTSSQSITQTSPSFVGLPSVTSNNTTMADMANSSTCDSINSVSTPVKNNSLTDSKNPRTPKRKPRLPRRRSSLEKYSDKDISSDIENQKKTTPGKSVSQVDEFNTFLQTFCSNNLHVKLAANINKVTNTGVLDKPSNNFGLPNNDTIIDDVLRITSEDRTFDNLFEDLYMYIDSQTNLSGSTPDKTTSPENSNHLMEHCSVDESNHVSNDTPISDTVSNAAISPINSTYSQKSSKDLIETVDSLSSNSVLNNFSNIENQVEKGLISSEKQIEKLTSKDGNLRLTDNTKINQPDISKQCSTSNSHVKDLFNTSIYNSGKSAAEIFHPTSCLNRDTSSIVSVIKNTKDEASTNIADSLVKKQKTLNDFDSTSTTQKIVNNISRRIDLPEKNTCNLSTTKSHNEVNQSTCNSEKLMTHNDQAFEKEHNSKNQASSSNITKAISINENTTNTVKESLHKDNKAISKNENVNKNENIEHSVSKSSVIHENHGENSVKTQLITPAVTPIKFQRPCASPVKLNSEMTQETSPSKSFACSDVDITAIATTDNSSVTTVKSSYLIGTPDKSTNFTSLNSKNTSVTTPDKLINQNPIHFILKGSEDENLNSENRKKIDMEFLNSYVQTLAGGKVDVNQSVFQPFEKITTTRNIFDSINSVDFLQESTVNENELSAIDTLLLLSKSPGKYQQQKMISEIDTASDFNPHQIFFGTEHFPDWESKLIDSSRGDLLVSDASVLSQDLPFNLESQIQEGTRQSLKNKKSNNPEKKNKTSSVINTRTLIFNKDENQETKSCIINNSLHNNVKRTSVNELDNHTSISKTPKKVHFSPGREILNHDDTSNESFILIGKSPVSQKKTVKKSLSLSKGKITPKKYQIIGNTISPVGSTNSQNSVRKKILQDHPIAMSTNLKEETKLPSSESFMSNYDDNVAALVEINSVDTDTFLTHNSVVKTTQKETKNKKVHNKKTKSNKELSKIKFNFKKPSKATTRLKSRSFPGCFVTEIISNSNTMNYTSDDDQKRKKSEDNKPVFVSNSNKKCKVFNKVITSNINIDELINNDTPIELVIENENVQAVRTNYEFWRSKSKSPGKCSRPLTPVKDRNVNIKSKKSNLMLQNNIGLNFENQNQITKGGTPVKDRNDNTKNEYSNFTIEQNKGASIELDFENQNQITIEFDENVKDRNPVKDKNIDIKNEQFNFNKEQNVGKNIDLNIENRKEITMRTAEQQTETYVPSNMVDNSNLEKAIDLSIMNNTDISKNIPTVSRNKCCVLLTKLSPSVFKTISTHSNENINEISTKTSTNNDKVLKESTIENTIECNSVCTAVKEKSAGIKRKLNDVQIQTSDDRKEKRRKRSLNALRGMDLELFMSKLKKNMP